MGGSAWSTESHQSAVDFVSGPVAGMCSDRVSSAWGRRRPFLVAGSLVSSAGLRANRSGDVAEKAHEKTQRLACPCAGFVLLYFASLWSWPKTFMLGLFVTEMALNVAYAAHAALPAETCLTDVLQWDLHLWANSVRRP